MQTILLAGLGNPGKEYEKTRHNAGFMFVDYIFQKYRDEFVFSDWEYKKSLDAEICIGKIKKEEKEKSKGLNFLAVAKKLSPRKKYPADARMILLKSQTFMNLSGEAVKKAVKYYKVRFDDLIVAHDEIDLLLGKYKIQSGASSAGHNGVQNAIEQLGTKNFTRVRIGVENRDDPASSAEKKKIPTEKYVLGKFTTAEIKIVSNILPEISEEITKNLTLSSRA